jgi:hypothetical protein
MNKADIEKAIFGLRSLLEGEGATEHDWQRWFEDNPVVFQCLGYQRHASHPDLTENGVVLFTPDFLVQRADNGLWEVFEIKTPSAEVIKSATRRQDFYASLSSYISQCAEYSEYFDDEAHRKEFEDRHGFHVHKSPARLLVAGRDEGLDHALAHQLLRRRGRPVELLTYDGLLKKLDFFRVQQFGDLEGLPGFSIHMAIAVGRLPGQTNFILDVGAEESKNRVSLFVDGHDRLCFRLIDSKGDPEVIRFPVGDDSGFSYDDWHYLVVEFGSGDGFTFMLMDVDGTNICFKRFLGAAVEPPKRVFVIGSDVVGTASTRIRLGQWFAATRTLTFNNRFGAIGFMQEYCSSPTRFIVFEGNQFLHSENHSLARPVKSGTDAWRTLVQPSSSLQPNYVDRSSGSLEATRISAVRAKGSNERLPDDN